MYKYGVITVITPQYYVQGTSTSYIQQSYVTQYCNSSPTGISGDRSKQVCTCPCVHYMCTSCTSVLCTQQGQRLGLLYVWYVLVHRTSTQYMYYVLVHSTRYDLCIVPVPRNLVPCSCIVLVTSSSTRYNVHSTWYIVRVHSSSTRYNVHSTMYIVRVHSSSSPSTYTTYLYLYLYV